MATAHKSGTNHGHAKRDRNHDGLPDKWEKKNHLSLKVNQAARDQDQDGLNNKGEFETGNSPRNPDTNADGVNDGATDQDGDGVDNANEVDEGTNPDRRRHER